MLKNLKTQQLADTLRIEKTLFHPNASYTACYLR